MIDAKNQASQEDDFFKSHWFKILATVLISLTTLVLCVVLILAALDIVNPDLFGASSKGEISNGHAESAMSYRESAISMLMAVLIALFGVMITGIFVFMTFRIDRGARNEALAIAQKNLKKMRSNVQKAVKEAKNEAAEAAKEEAQIIARETAIEKFEDLIAAFKEKM